MTSSVLPVDGVAAESAPLATSIGKGHGFASMLLEKVSSVDQDIKAANAQIAAFSVGEDIAPHQVMLALEDARIQLSLLLQVRNRLVEGYQELMRMQL